MTKQITKIIEMGVQSSVTSHEHMVKALAALAQENARKRLADATKPAAFAGNSSGSAGDSGFNMVSVVLPTKLNRSELATPGMASRANFYSRLPVLDSNHKELAMKLNQYLALIAPGYGSIVIPTPPSSPNYTMERINLLGETTSDGVLASAALAELSKARNNQSAIIAALNWARVALGLAPVTDNSGGVFEGNDSSDWVMVEHDTTNQGSAAAVGQDSVSIDTCNATITALRDNLATLYLAIDALRVDANIGPFVVATNNPRWKFKNGDINPA